MDIKDKKQSNVILIAILGGIVVATVLIIGTIAIGRRASIDTEDASRAKSRFVSDMSHEIRTPITAILGMNEMIHRECDDKSILGYSDAIDKAGTSLLGIISDILDFSKIELGKMELVDVCYSLPSMIRDLYNLIYFKADGKGLEVDLDIDETLPSDLYGDELRVKQIIANLLTNAVKYTDEGRIKLTITSELLEQMGSRLEVESTYDVGSRFYFSLKQGVADTTQIGRFDKNTLLGNNNGQKEQQVPFKAPGAKILIVDDTPMNLQVIKALLKRTCMQMDTAESGEECIELFEKNDYNIVFLDYRMPGMVTS